MAGRDLNAEIKRYETTRDAMKRAVAANPGVSRRRSRGGLRRAFRWLPGYEG